MDVPFILIAVFKGVLAGGGAALIGYLKSVKDGSNGVEPFDSVKFTRTVLLGAVIGGIMGALDVDVNTVEGYAVYPLIVLGIDAVAKVVARRVVTPLYEKLKKLLSQ